MLSERLISRPTHQVRHICKAHKADTQKPTLQKNLPCANARATLYGWTQTHIIDDSGDRANVQHWYLQKLGGRKPCFNFCFSIWLHIGQDVINLAMCKSSTFIYKFSFR